MDRQMEIEEILTSIEEMLEQAKTVPFSDKVLVDREELFDAITDIRLKMPTEIEQSKWVLEEKNRIIVDAQHEAEAKIKEAEEERLKMINEHEVTRKAYAQAEEIVDRAVVEANAYRSSASQYMDDMLGQLEDNTTQSLESLTAIFANFHNSLSGYIETIRENRTELLPQNEEIQAARDAAEDQGYEDMPQE